LFITQLSLWILAIRDQAGISGNSLAHSQSVRSLTAVDGVPEEEQWSSIAGAMYEVDDVRGQFPLFNSD
jgi:hypothetical protein